MLRLEAEKFHNFVKSVEVVLKNKIMKFEKGKKVRVVRKSNDYDFDIPKIVIMNDTGSVYKDLYFSDEEDYIIRYDDCEEITPTLEDKPTHYQTRTVNGMDVIDLIKHWNLNFNEGNILKYLLRDKGQDIKDLEKIVDYAQREIKYLNEKV